MRKSIGIIGAIVLAAALSSSALAKNPHDKGNGNDNGNGGESQAGGLPALEDRVDALQALVNSLKGQIAALQGQVASLQGAVTTLQGSVTTLQGQTTDLLGQNNWAVVKLDGTLVRSHSSAGAVASSHLGAAGSGMYEVDFTQNVSGCAYVAVQGDTGTATPPIGEVSVSGDPDGDTTGVFVQTSTSAGAPTDASFQLYVSCP